MTTEDQTGDILETKRIKAEDVSEQDIDHTLEQFWSLIKQIPHVFFSEG